MNNINNKLALSNRTSIGANCEQIVKKLIERYHYVGVYNSRYISEFMKLHSDAFSNEDTFERLIAQIKLNDLEQKPEQYNELFTVDAQDI